MRRCISCRRFRLLVNGNEIRYNSRRTLKGVLIQPQGSADAERGLGPKGSRL